MNEKDIPEDYKCPITLEIMRDPVSTINGFTYERRAIEESILIKEVEPMTNLPLSSTILLPNTRLKEEIDNFRVSDKKLLKTQVTFDFENHLITLKINGETILKEFNPNNLDSGPWWKILSIEYHIDEYSKWVFTWREWSCRQQFFELSKYTQPTAGKPGDPVYQTWSELANWQHISDPQPGTIQTSNVYRTRYRESLFLELKELYFEVIGRSGKNWNTHKYITGGTGW